MTVGTGNFAELLWPGIKEIWGDAYTEWDPKWSQILYEHTSDKSFEKMQGIVGTGVATVKDQGKSIDYEDPLQGYQQEYMNVTYGKGSSITFELWQDDQYNEIRKVPRWLARSLRHTEEITGHNPLNNATTTVLSADGLTLMNTAHVLIGTGGTLSNMGESGVTYALSQTTLEQACIFISRWTDDQGLRANIMAKKLIVPNELMYTAERILETEYEVDTANNAINPVRGKLPLVVSPWLTDPDAWFITTEVTTEGDGLVRFTRMKPDLQRDNEFNTRNLLFSSVGRWSTGATDWRGLWGSTG